MGEHLPEARSKVDGLIEKLLHLFEQYDPLDLIAPISLYRYMGDPEAPRSAKDTEPVSDVEHLLSLATSRSFPSGATAPDSASIQTVFDTLEELRVSLVHFDAARDASAADVSDQQEASFIARSETLFVRGNEYEVIACELFVGLYSRVEKFLVDRFGFAAEDIIEFYHAIERQMELKGQTFIEDFRQKATPLMAAFDEFRRKGPEGMQPLVLEDPLPNPTKEILEIRPQRDRDHNICEALSHEFGENKGFLEDMPEWRGWPLNPSLVQTKPVIRHKGRYYLPCPPTAFWNLKESVEALIKDADAEFYEKQLSAARANFLVDRTAALLSGLFGSAHVHTNAYYSEAGTQNLCEADIIVSCGSVLLLVECKSGHVTPSARRGSPSRLLRDLGSLVADPQKQGLRTLSSVSSQARTEFTNSKGEHLLSVNGSIVRHVFVICVTLDHLGGIACDSSLLRRLQVIDPRAVPWVVSLADLIAINEILDRPAIFLDFLQRRVRAAAEHPQLRAHDELDLLMFYIHRGLWFEKGVFDGTTAFQIGNWTDELDRYYRAEYLASRPEKPSIPAVEKPRHRLSTQLSPVLSALELDSDRFGLSCGIALLGMDEETQRGIVEELDKLEQRVRSDGELHTLTVVVTEADYALVFVAHLGMFNEDAARRYAAHQFRKGLETVYVVSWLVPLSKAAAMTWVFEQTTLLGRAGT